MPEEEKQKARREAEVWTHRANVWEAWTNCMGCLFWILFPLALLLLLLTWNVLKA